MKPKRINHSQGSLLEPRLSELLDPQNRLRLLADLIDWKELESQLGSDFHSEKGAPGKPIRLVSFERKST